MVTAYSFTTPFPADHFVSRYIAWASKCTDASHEYHEAVALAILGAAVPDLRADLLMFPDGLPMNLYSALIGDTTDSRKSTAMGLGRHTYTQVHADGVLPQRMTPEGFVDQLAQRSPGTSLWGIDEMSKFLVEILKREHLQALQGLLLSAYDGGDFTYSRSKKKKQADDVKIEKPHLTIIGGTTPTVFDEVTVKDVQSGLLPRFAIIYPDTKPSRKSIKKMIDSGARVEQNALIKTLHDLRPVAGSLRSIRFSEESLDILDVRIAELEATRGHQMLARLPVMAMKVAMLSAVGQGFALGPQTDFLVSADDARIALTVINRWARYAIKFEKELSEGFIEKFVKRAITVFRMLNGKREIAKQHDPLKVTRRTVSRFMHTDAKVMRDLQDVLLDRGIIDVEDSANRRKDSVIWVWHGHDGEAPDDRQPTDTTVTVNP